MRMTAKKTSSKMIMTTKIDNPCDQPGDGVRSSCGYWLSILGILGDCPGDGDDRPWIFGIILGMGLTILGMVGGRPWDGR